MDDLAPEALVKLTENTVIAGRFRLIRRLGRVISPRRAPSPSGGFFVRLGN